MSVDPLVTIVPNRLDAEATIWATASSDPLMSQLKPRERELLGMIASGLRSREMANRLGIQEKTVKNYTAALLKKMGMPGNRIRAAVYATAVRYGANADESHGK